MLRYVKKMANKRLTLFVKLMLCSAFDTRMPIPLPFYLSLSIKTRLFVISRHNVLCGLPRVLRDGAPAVAHALRAVPAAGAL